MTGTQSISRLLAVINGAPESRAVARMAVALGKQSPCLIDGLHVMSDDALFGWPQGMMFSGPMPAPVAEELHKQQKDRRDAANAIFSEETANLPRLENGALPDKTHTSVRWQEVRGREWYEVAHQGRSHDLVLVAQPKEPRGISETDALEAALFDSGRPVLVVPDNETNTPGRSIALAWSDSRESSRSIWAALPFLEKAERVSLIVVDSGEDEAAGLEQINEYLLHKDIDVEIIRQPDNGAPIGDQILSCAEDVNADMLIMGAYGHSRLREMVLGGATRDVLRSAQMPVLMAH